MGGCRLPRRLEEPTPAQALGIALALVGVFLASREGDGTARARALAAGAGLALLAALSFGLLLVALDAASDADALWATLVLRGTAFALFATAAVAVRPSFSLGQMNLAVLAVIGVLDTGGNALFAVASSMDLLSLVSVLAQLYPIVTVFLAWTILRERISRVQRSGVAAACAGVALITAG